MIFGTIQRALGREPAAEYQILSTKYREPSTDRTTKLQPGRIY